MHASCSHITNKFNLLKPKNLQFVVTKDNISNTHHVRQRQANQERRHQEKEKQKPNPTKRLLVSIVCDSHALIFIRMQEMKSFFKKRPEATAKK